jgi:hypothetical protein
MYISLANVIIATIVFVPPQGRGHDRRLKRLEKRRDPLDTAVEAQVGNHSPVGAGRRRCPGSAKREKLQRGHDGLQERESVQRLAGLVHRSACHR